MWYPPIPLSSEALGNWGVLRNPPILLDTIKSKWNRAEVVDDTYGTYYIAKHSYDIYPPRINPNDRWRWSVPRALFEIDSVAQEIPGGCITLISISSVFSLVIITVSLGYFHFAFLSSLAFLYARHQELTSLLFQMRILGGDLGGLARNTIFRVRDWCNECDWILLILLTFAIVLNQRRTLFFSFIFAVEHITVDTVTDAFGLTSSNRGI